MSSQMILDKNALYCRFNLRQLKDITAHFSNHLTKQSIKTSITTSHKTPITKSAVLIPLIIRNGVIHVILTKRSAHLRHHPNQLSFPGGKFDADDKSLRHTALRETHEELAIEHKNINVIGELPLHYTMTGFSIKPYVAFVDSHIKITANTNEVSEIIEVPMIELINNNNHFSMPIKYASIDINVYFKPINGHVVWGATAAMLEQFTLSLTD